MILSVQASEMKTLTTAGRWPETCFFSRLRVVNSSTTVMLVPIQTRLVRFGAFEADLRTCELRKHGLRIKLQDQPFQVLALLLQRPGEMVSREELRQNLWSEDTFVDFDVGLNNAIKRLREALCDPAEHPRYVETLPRRGYRFYRPNRE